MYRKIISGHDGSEGGDDTLALADTIRRATGGELTVIGVFPDGPFVDPVVVGSKRETSPGHVSAGHVGQGLS